MRRWFSIKRQKLINGGLFVIICEPSQLFVQKKP